MNRDWEDPEMTCSNVPEEYAKRIGYDAATQVLEIVDATNHVWRFFDVSAQTGGGVLGSRQPTDIVLNDLCSRFRHASW
jgi:hypothetical protein